MIRNALCYCERTVKCVATFELYELQQTNKFTDRTLQSEDGAVFNIHTIVMSSLSHEFRDMMPEETHPCLPYSTEVVSTIVELAYTGDDGKARPVSSKARVGSSSCSSTHQVGIIFRLQRVF